MKRIFYSFGAVALTFLAISCQKEVFESAAAGGIELDAVLEQQMEATAKTYLDGGAIKWTETADEIAVLDNVGKSAKLYARKVDAQDARKANFVEPEIPVRDDGFDESSVSFAFYPYGKVVSCSEGVVTYRIPDTQTYVENSFGAGDNVAIGLINDGNISFKNVGGALKLSLKTTAGTYAKLGRIVITDPENFICGDYTVAPGDEPAAEYVESTGGHSVTLLCNGVTLTDAEYTNFYIALPTGSLSNGFSVDVYSALDHPITNLESTLVSTDEKEYNIINRSTVRSMPKKEVPFLPTAYYECSWITNNFDSFINTDYYLSPGLISMTLDFTKPNNAGVNIAACGYDSSAGYLGGIYYNGNMNFYLGKAYVETRDDLRVDWNHYESEQNFNTKTWTLNANGEISSGTFNSGGSGSSCPVIAFRWNTAAKPCAICSIKYFEVISDGVTILKGIPAVCKEPVKNAENIDVDAFTAGLFNIADSRFWTSQSTSGNKFSYQGEVFEPTILTADDVSFVEYIENKNASACRLMLEDEPVEAWQYEGKFEDGTNLKGNIIGAYNIPDASDYPYVGNTFRGSRDGGDTAVIELYFYNNYGGLSVFSSPSSGSPFVLDVSFDYANATYKAAMDETNVKTGKMTVPAAKKMNLKGLSLFGIGDREGNCVKGSGDWNGKVYYLNVTLDGVLRRALHPAKAKKAVAAANGSMHSAGVAGFWDEVSGMFFAAEIGGDFVAGPEITNE